MIPLKTEQILKNYGLSFKYSTKLGRAKHLKIFCVKKKFYTTLFPLESKIPRGVYEMIRSFITSICLSLVAVAFSHEDKARGRRVVLSTPEQVG